MNERDDAALIRLLNQHSIPYVVVGGWAVITHGYIRYTKDIDVLVQDCDSVASALAVALEKIHAETLHGEAISATTRLPEQGWQVNTDYGRIDILLEGAPPLDFASVHASAVETNLDGESMRVADLAHLVALKRLAGRPHDRVDIEELEAMYGPLPRLSVPGVDFDLDA